MGRKEKDDILERIQFLIRSQDPCALEDMLLIPDIKGSTCTCIVDGLIQLKSPEAWDAIGRLVISGEAAVVELILQRLENTPDPGAIRALGEALSNPSVFVRSAAVRALSRISSTVVIAHLLRATRDPDPSLARMASRVLLRKIEEQPRILNEIREGTAEGILELVDDRWTTELLSPEFPEGIRILAARRLGGIGGEEASQVLARMLQTADGDLLEECAKALENCPGVPDFVLLPLLVDSRPEIRTRATRVYGRVASPDSCDLIRGLAGDAETSVRIEALGALCHVDPIGAIPALAAALDDSEEEVRLMAIDLLTGIPDSTPELVQTVHLHDGDVRKRALISLANKGVVDDRLTSAYVDFLYRGASCTDLSKRDYLDSLAATAKTLGNSQNPDVLPALGALAHSVVRRLRRAAIEGIMGFKPQERAHALHDLEDTHDPDILKNVAMGLHEVGDKRAVIPLIRAALECRGRTAAAAQQALKKYKLSGDVDFLIKCLSGNWPSVRRFGAERLKDLHDRKSIEPLLKASQDTNVDVQLAVFEAMAPFAGDNDGVRERMLETLGFGDISVRQAACEALGNARCKAAVPDLIKALHNFFLRPRATDALKRIGDRKGCLAIKRIERRERLFPKKPRDVLLEDRKSGL